MTAEQCFMLDKIWQCETPDELWAYRDQLNPDEKLEFEILLQMLIEQHLDETQTDDTSIGKILLEGIGVNCG